MPGGHKGTVDDLEVEVELELSREPTDGGVEAFTSTPSGCDLDL
jgi:hypothetical protein